MYFSKEFLIGISFASIGIAGVSFLLSRRKNSTTHLYGMKNMEDFLEDENDKFFDAESKSFRSVSDDEFVSCRSTMSSVASVSFRTVSDMESVIFRTTSDEDSGSFRTMPDENLNDNTKIVKSIGELYMDAVEKQAFEDLQHNFKVVEINCLALKHHVADAMYTFQQTADDQRLSSDSLKLEVACLKKDLNRLTSLKNTEMQSTETNTEKPDCCKLRRLKTRVSVLESDVMKNSIDIVGINDMLMLMLPSSGAAAENDVSAGENLFELDTLNAQCHEPTSPNIPVRSNSASDVPGIDLPPVAPMVEMQVTTDSPSTELSGTTPAATAEVGEIESSSTISSSLPCVRLVEADDRDVLQSTPTCNMAALQFEGAECKNCTTKPSVHRANSVQDMALTHGDRSDAVTNSAVIAENPRREVPDNELHFVTPMVEMRVTTDSPSTAATAEVGEVESPSTISSSLPRVRPVEADDVLQSTPTCNMAAFQFEGAECKNCTTKPSVHLANSNQDMVLTLHGDRSDSVTNPTVTAVVPRRRSLWSRTKRFVRRMVCCGAIDRNV